MCRVDDMSRREEWRRQTAFVKCEPRASATAGSRAGSFRVLAGPGTTAGRSLSSRASSLAPSSLCLAGHCVMTGRSQRTWACPARRRPRTCLRFPTAAGLGLPVLTRRRVACYSSAGPVGWPWFRVLYCACNKGELCSLCDCSLGVWLKRSDGVQGARLSLCQARVAR